MPLVLKVLPVLLALPVQQARQAQQDQQEAPQAVPLLDLMAVVLRTAGVRVLAVIPAIPLDSILQMAPTLTHCVLKINSST